MMEEKIYELKKIYEDRRDEIKKRLEEFKKVFYESDERVFAELSFCICTPQSKATSSWNAISSLMKNNFLFNGNVEQIRPFLNNIRFGKSKANHIVEARKLLNRDGIWILRKELSKTRDQRKLREWLIENIKGLGMKESSHFLRNVGLGNELAILDRHILKNLLEYGVIDEMPKNLSKKVYIEIEDKMKKFSDFIGIPMSELDLLFWSKETGIVFK